MAKRKSVPCKVFLVSHGDFAEGLKNTAEMIVGAHSNLYAFGLHRGGHPDEIVAEIEKLIDPEEWTFILGDLAGGSVCNAALRLTTNERVVLVSGMNLPLAIQFVLTPPDSPEALEKLLSESRLGLKQLVLQRPDAAEEEFF